MLLTLLWNPSHSRPGMSRMPDGETNGHRAQRPNLRQAAPRSSEIGRTPMDESIEVETASLDQTLLWASRTILDSVADAIVTIDEQGQIRAANRAANELFEYSPDEIGQLHIAELVGTRDRRQLDLYLNVFLASASRTPGTESWFEAEGIRKDGSSFPMELRASPLV